MKRHAFTLSGMALTASLLMVAPLAMIGCQQDQRTDYRTDVGFSTTASHSTIMAGETVTFTVNSSNTLGRDVDVKWSSTGGNLDVDKGGRVARVTFDKSGTYSVKADLYLDGNLYKADTKIVTVKPLH